MRWGRGLRKAWRRESGESYAAGRSERGAKVPRQLRPQYGPVLAILQVTFPFFALVFCGYLAARRRMLPLEAIGGLNAFVLFFALPCMLYRCGASTPIAQLLDPCALLVYLACALLMVAGAVGFSLNERIRW